MSNEWISVAKKLHAEAEKVKITEKDKALLDASIYGTGAVFVSKNGTVKHIPIDKLLDDLPSPPDTGEK